MLSSGENMLPYLPRPSFVDQRWKPNVELAPNCPRCDSSNTKFCYYNNYSHSQPRYFCKGCRRYWTKGGSLRNVPVGGGCRKNRSRSKSVRVSADRVVSPGEANYGRPPSNFLRPDLVLDDRAGGNPRSQSSGNSTVSSSAEALGSATAAGSGTDIDLALLYAKFLNHGADDLEPGLAVPELPVGADEAFDLAGVLNSEFHMPSVIPEVRPSSEFLTSSTGELGFPSDPSSWASLVLPAGGVIVAGGDDDDVFWSNCPTTTVPTSASTWQSSQNQGFELVQEGHVSMIHPNLPDGNWGATAFDL